MMDQEGILAEASIKSLVTRERYYRDSCQWERLRECYHPDSSQTNIDITWYQGDIEGFIQGSKSMSEKGSNAIHSIVPNEVTVNRSKAFSISVGSIAARFTRGDTEYELFSNCRFLSRLEKVEGQPFDSWKMLSMEVIYVNDKISPVIPGSKTDMGAFQGVDSFPRDSYKMLAYFLTQKGYQVKQDLPGVDNERLVSDVLDRNLSWLNN